MTRRIKDKIVEPNDGPTGESDSISIFERAEWSSEDAKWLGPLCFLVLGNPDKDGTGLDWLTEQNLKAVAAAWQDSGSVRSRNRALLIAYTRMFGCGGKKSQVSFKAEDLRPELAGQCRTVADVFRLHGADFETALVAGGWPGEYWTDNELTGIILDCVRDRNRQHRGIPEIARLMHLLVEGARIDLTKVVDAQLLIDAGAHRIKPNLIGTARTPAPIDRKLPSIASPTSLVTWMIGIGPQALLHFFPTFRETSDEKELSAFAYGVRDAIERWLICLGQHETYFREGGKALAAGSLPYFEELQRRRSWNHEQLRRCWLWFAWCTFEADKKLLSSEQREQLLRAATEGIAGLRPLLSRAKLKQSNPAGMPAGPLEPWEEFAWEQDHLQTCLIFLFQFGGIWRGMKPMLLALRALDAPAVASDLRYWSEPDHEVPPEPWCVIVAWTVNLFHNYVHVEQVLDEQLIRLRGELAAFCLERLVDRWSKIERQTATNTGRRRTNDDMVERSPEWRLCLIRAFNSLGLNPLGKGHRALHASAEIDPDEGVQEAARDAYQRIRRGMTLPEDVSPRRALMSALWWIRQAHLLDLQARHPELEIQLDANGAQRTRTKELTRTKEAEQADNPAHRNKN